MEPILQRLLILELVYVSEVLSWISIEKIVQHIDWSDRAFGDMQINNLCVWKQ